MLSGVLELNPVLLQPAYYHYDIARFYYVGLKLGFYYHNERRKEFLIMFHHKFLKNIKECFIFLKVLCMELQMKC